MKELLMIFLAATLAGCSFGPAVKQTPATYDLGIPRYNDIAGGKTINVSLLVYDVEAPFWLDTPAIVYRFKQDAGRQQSYADSQWVAPPAALLTQRLRGRFTQTSTGGVVGVTDGVRADYTLRVELEDFAQVFDRADASRGVIMARASLVNATRRVLVAQKDFTFDHAAAISNAEGGVEALTDASDDLIDAIVTWTAASIATVGK